MSILVPAQFPSLTAVFMAAALSILVLFLARVLFLFVRFWACPTFLTDAHDKLSLVSTSKPWGPSLQWSTLPFTFALLEKSSPEEGNATSMGFSQKHNHMLPVGNWQPRTGPRFQHPPPALYESPVPLSMAKMIMSRHTFRKPNPTRTRRSSTSFRSASPQQTPSRPYHSIA